MKSCEALDKDCFFHPEHQETTGDLSERTLDRKKKGSVD